MNIHTTNLTKLRISELEYRLEVMKAYLAGKKIGMQDRNMRCIPSEIQEPAWNWNDYNYVIME